MPTRDPGLFLAADPLQLGASDVMGWIELTP